MNDYQSCVRTNGQQTGQLAVYEGLLTGGLQSQINTLKQDQMWAFYYFGYKSLKIALFL